MQFLQNSIRLHSVKPFGRRQSLRPDCRMKPHPGILYLLSAYKWKPLLFKVRSSKLRESCFERLERHGYQLGIITDIRSCHIFAKDIFNDSNGLDSINKPSPIPLVHNQPDNIEAIWQEDSRLRIGIFMRNLKKDAPAGMPVQGSRA